MAARPLLCLLLLGTSAAAQETRPQITGVSSVRIANYGAPSTVITQRAPIADVVGELNGLRRKGWQRGEVKLSCYSTLVLLRGEKKVVGEFRIRPDQVVERPVEKGQSSYSVSVGADDLPGIRKLLEGIAPMNHKDCTP
jgi:hypothetical protein